MRVDSPRPSAQAGLDLGASLGEAIVPVMTGDSVRAGVLSQRLFQQGVNVQPIIAPAIPERLARLRFFVSSEHAPDDIAASAKAVAEGFSAMNGAVPTALLLGKRSRVTGLRVVPVDDGAGIAAFIAAGRRAQASNTHWVEPAHEEIRTIFSRRKAPFMRENVVQPFVAFLDGEPVGRIVATIEAAHLKKFDDACGFFGFIDAIDDHAVFAALFAEAERFLRSRGHADGARSVQFDH